MIGGIIIIVLALGGFIWWDGSFTRALKADRKRQIRIRGPIPFYPVRDSHFPIPPVVGYHDGRPYRLDNEGEPIFGYQPPPRFRYDLTPTEIDKLYRMGVLTGDEARAAWMEPPQSVTSDVVAGYLAKRMHPAIAPFPDRPSLQNGDTDHTREMAMTLQWFDATPKPRLRGYTLEQLLEPYPQSHKDGLLVMECEQEYEQWRNGRGWLRESKGVTEEDQGR